MNTNHLNTFFSVCKWMSFTKAAKELFLTQSAVSQQIQAIEQEIGTTLFDRQGRQTILTSAGESFLADVAPLMKLYDQAIVNAQRANKVNYRHFTLAAVHSYADYWLPQTLRDLMRHNRDVNISLKSECTSNLVNTLQRGIVDAIVTLEPDVRDVPNLKFIPLRYFSAVVYLHPAHRWASRKSISLGELERERLIFISGQQGRHLHYLFRMLSNSKGIRWSKYILADSGETALGMAAADMGIYLGLDMEEGYARHLGLVPIDLEGLDSNDYARMGIAYINDAKRELCEQLIDCAANYAGELIVPEDDRKKTTA